MTHEIIPTDYQAFLHTIKTRVQEAQVRAVLAVNTELILLYWYIGNEILARQTKEGWGTGVIARLSRDLHAAFPQMKGFSPRNLGYMKVFASTYPDEAILQQLVAKLPWGHQITLLEKVKDEQERLWYMEQALAQGWSRSILEIQIETNVFGRKGKALTNFQKTLPALQSDLVNDTLKDPYVFDFIATGDETKERNLQSALLAHIQRFLLELGVGFTFVGGNYHLVVGDQDFYLDLLFYHIRLRCFVVIELKTTEFKPEYAGKMNFYLTAVDEQIKHQTDNPTIGMILCRGKGNHVVAEYALRDIRKPVGIATYQFTTALPDAFKAQLPTIADLEAQLKDADAEIEGELE